MKSLTVFLQMVLQDLGDWCCISTTRDLKTVTSRYEHEGLSFLTIALPAFGADLQKGLDQGRVSDDLFMGFSRSGGLPRFLGGFLRNVFDPCNGVLLEDPCTASIWAVRQFTLMFAKMNLPCTKTRVDRAVSGYLQCESDLRNAPPIEPALYESFLRIGRLLWADFLSDVDLDIFNGEIIPKHGPGATADKIRGNAKWRQLKWTRRLDAVFPHWEHLTSSDKISYELLPPVEICEPGAETPVRVITVPKTLKTPRIIAVEPTCMQYMQQGILGVLERNLERHNLPSKLISWKSQVFNQELAREGSISGELATLDLSEASDRVSNQHVRDLLQNHPHLFAAVDACRSRKADVPGHGVIRLAKFASMGSALCFPFESMVFMTLVFLGIERELSHQITKKEIYSYLGTVRTYGDDIIIPARFMRSVIGLLEAFGLKVNRDKSFGDGKFRESCGRDYYDGIDVSIVRLRSIIPTSQKDVSGIVSTVSTRNQLYHAGMWRAAHFLDGCLERLIPFPYVLPGSPVLGRHSFLGLEDPVRFDSDLQRPVVKGVVVKAEPPVDRLDGYAALLKCLTYASLRGDNSDLPVTGVDHLERSGRPFAVDIKRVWGTPV